jgi:hypothetical protein
MNVTRRDFLINGAGLAAVSTLAPPFSATGTTEAVPSQPGTLGFERSSDHIRISGQNGIVVDFLVREKQVRGIGNVALKGKPLRSPGECIWPEIATPYAVEICHLELQDVRQQDGSVIIATRPYYRRIHRMEWTEHAMHPLVNTGSWSKDPFSPEGSSLDWILRQVDESYAGVSYTGFSYSFRYNGPGNPIYQIEDKATWELGGNIVGNGFILRGGNEPHTRFAADTNLYSGWDFPGIANPHVFQHKPLYTQMQGFTFQYDSEHVLVTVHENPSHVRTLYQRLAGQPTLLHFNQFCFDLTTEHSTPARKILVGPRKNDDETALVNHYLRVRDTLQEQHRKHYGLRYDKARPAVHAEANGLGIRERFNPVFVAAKDWGVHRVFIMPIWRSPDSDINPIFEKQKDRFGVFGNLCCPLELEIADCYGGWEGFREMMGQAKANGLDPYIWHASHFSSITPLTRKIPDLFCRDVNGQNNRNNYGHVLWAVNQRSPRYQQYLMATYRKAKAYGLGGIFHDSHFNLATDTINFLHTDYYKEGPPFPDADKFSYPSDQQHQDQILSMHDTALELQRRLQTEIGLIYQVESEGALGTPQTHPDYKYMRNSEYLYSNMEVGLDPEDYAPFHDDPKMIYFRGLSVRLIYAIQIDPNIFPDAKSISAWWKPEEMVPFIKAYNVVEDYMDELWVLQDDRGTLWKGKGAEVLFAYKDFTHEVFDSCEVHDVTSGLKFVADGKFQARSFGIYLFGVHDR